MSPTLVVIGFINGLLVTAGLGGASITPLVINQELHSVTITMSPSPTPWTIDPERTQQLT
jgi:hypothetical protein